MCYFTHGTLIVPIWNAHSSDWERGGVSKSASCSQKEHTINEYVCWEHSRVGRYIFLTYFFVILKVSNKQILSWIFDENL